MKYSNKLSPALEQRDKVFIRNMSEKRETGKMRSFQEAKVHVVVENTNNENIAYKVIREMETDERIRVLHKKMRQSPWQLQLEGQ